jgi:hypothetical protein
MKALLIPDGELDITPLSDRKQYVKLDEPITWRWDIVASERGPHLLSLNITAYVDTPKQGGGYRTVEQNPPLFDDYINVSATWWELLTDFVAHQWQVLVPIFLTILTAIIIPFVLPWWRRRHQPDELRDRSSGAPRDDRWI